MFFTGPVYEWLWWGILGLTSSRQWATHVLSLWILSSQTATPQTRICLILSLKGWTEKGNNDCHLPFSLLPPADTPRQRGAEPGLWSHVHIGGSLAPHGLVPLTFLGFHLFTSDRSFWVSQTNEWGNEWVAHSRGLSINMNHQILTH